MGLCSMLILGAVVIESLQHVVSSYEPLGTLKKGIFPLEVTELRKSKGANLRSGSD